jgi:antitoxin (DNA-binding transcriptional repressor) of toxin-antitoxin stability system
MQVEKLLSHTTNSLALEISALYPGGVHGVRLSGTVPAVRVTSTEFRKNLFRIVERALQGEFVEVAHKGRVVRLVPGDKPSKMSRLIQRDTIRGTAKDLDRGQKQLDTEMRTSWEAPNP